MEYCEFCGKQLNDKERCSCPEAQQKRVKRAKLRKLLIGIGIPTILVAIVITVLLGSVKTDPFDYISVSFEGYSSNGSATVNMDALMINLIGEAPPEGDWNDYEAWLELYEEHAGNIKVECSPNTELTNGDTITVKVTVSGETAKKVRSGSKDYVVSGLAEVELVDVFANVNIAVEGVSGAGFAKVTLKNKDDDFMDALSFTVGGDVKNGQLSNGDSVTITAKYSDNLIEKHLKMPKSNTVTIVVSGLSSYATKDDLPAATIAAIAQQFIAEKEADLEPTSMFTYSPVELYGVYFAEQGEDNYAEHYNELHILIGYTEYKNGEYDDTVYLPLYFRDIVVNADGTVDLNYEEGKQGAFAYSDAEKYVKDLKEDYKVTKIQ